MDVEPVSASFFSKLLATDAAVIKSSGAALIVLMSTFSQCNATGLAFAGAIAELGTAHGFVINTATPDGTSIH
jgi:hypothetical protein